MAIHLSLPSNDGVIDMSLHSMQSTVPELGWNDIRIGRILGKGSFHKVKEVAFRSRRKEKYAIKYLRTSKATKKADADLRMEGQLLSLLQHEHIIEIHAQGYNNDDYYFLIMDRLNDTLERVLSDWIYTTPFFESNISWDVPSIQERIESIALPVASALEYLHSNNVVLGNLKPSNVGFDRNGTVKLFDFSSARLVDQDETSQVPAAGSSSSLLYMAPEVMQSLEYGLPVDVYSFAIMLWELLTLDVPFEDMSQSALEQAVVRENARPVLDKSVGSRALQEMISNAWDASPESRPNFAAIRQVLENEVTVVGMDITIEIDQSSSSSSSTS